MKIRTVLLASLLGCAACGRSAESGPSQAFRSEGEVVYVDTHDDYAHTNGVNKSLFGQYFQRVNGAKVVALTFDCAWIDREKAEDILDALSRNRIKATFFISGPFLFKSYRRGSVGGLDEANLPIIKRMVDEGHDIANHSTTHPHNGDGPDWAWELSDLNKGWSMAMKRLYGEALPSNATMRPYWRAPYGEYNHASLSTAARAGFPYHFGWNVDVRDTVGAKDCREERTSTCLDPGKLTDYVLRFAEKNAYDLDAIVVLAHLSNYYWWGRHADGIDRLASEMRSHGYSFARLAETFRFGGAHVRPARNPGAIECPVGFSLASIGNEGGRYCEDAAGQRVLGPFTETMQEKCRRNGGGAACQSEVWAKDLALRLRGPGLCPNGAHFDDVTTYCIEGDNAFGPFPKSLVERCLATGGGEPCRGARWNRNFLRSLLGR